MLAPRADAPTWRRWPPGPATTRTGCWASTTTGGRSRCGRGGRERRPPPSTGRPMRRIHDAGVFEVLLDAEPSRATR